MKIGVISDVHSNYRAFKECIDYLKKAEVDYFLLLGDYVSDTPRPEKVMGMIYGLKEEYPVLMVRGNREDYFLEDRLNDKGWTDCSATGNLLYTKERLTEADLDFFEKLPISGKLCLEGYPSITFCHGSPTSTREHIYMDTQNSDKWLDEIDTEYLLAGHTHQRCIYRHKGKTYINTGSCGIAIHNAKRAECVLLTGVNIDGEKDWDVEFLSLPYDVEALVEEMFQSGLYERAHWFMNTNIQTLTSGIDRASTLVEAANEIMKSELDGTVGKFPSEKNFEQAAERLNVPDYANNRNPVYVRMATEDDAEELLSIYSYYVEETAVSFETVTPSVLEFQERIRNIRKDFPYYVAEKDGKILGYAYASKFRTREAYSWSSEFSIYVAKESHRLGIGSLLLDAITETLKRQGIVNLYAVVTDSSEDTCYSPKESLPFHRKNGFNEEFRLSKVGVKFGKWFDIVYLVRRLSENVSNPPKPQPYFTQKDKW